MANTVAEPPLFASSSEEPRPRTGFSIWLAAAAALVIGIGIGFASGYRMGKGQAVVAAPADPAPTSGATGGRPFSESTVSEPVNLNAPPIVPAPETPAGPLRGPQSAAEHAPQRPQVPQPQTAKAPAAVKRAPPPRAESRSAADPPAPALSTATGPGSLQVVSRPAGAQVILDGRTIGKTPLTISDVAVGYHNVQLELTGFKEWSTTVGVKAGSSTRVAASLEQ